MALTRDFRKTVVERAQKDPEFRIGLLEDAIDEFLSGEDEDMSAKLEAIVREQIKKTARDDGEADDPTSSDMPYPKRRSLSPRSP